MTVQYYLNSEIPTKRGWYDEGTGPYPKTNPEKDHHFKWRHKPEEFDPVNKPKHYNSHPSGIEPIDITQHENFCIGNAIKYLIRCDHKGSPIQDLEKAVWYIKKEIERRKGEA